MLTITLLLVLSAFVVTIAAAIRPAKAPLWVAVLLLVRNTATMTPEQQAKYWDVRLRQMEVLSAFFKPLGDLILKLAAK